MIVKDDSLSLAIGRKGVNARLAVKLTGYNIDIKVESEALEMGLEYTSFEEISALELEQKQERIAQAAKEKLVYQNATSLPGVPEGYVAPQERTYEEESNDFDSTLEEVAESEENAPVQELQPEVKEEPVVEEVKEVEEAVEEPVVEEPKEEVSSVEVKTTTTIADLEASLANSGSNKKKKENNRRKKKVEEEEEETVVLHGDSPRMSIYTEEELAEMDEEDADFIDEDEDDIDYDEYDQYYDEN